MSSNHNKKASANDELHQIFGANTTFITMTEADPTTGATKLEFELADGRSMKPKYIKKIDGRWSEVEHADRLANVRRGRM